MQYKTEDGKTVRIPDEDIKRMMDSLGMSKEEAIDLWLCDNDYEEDEEQNELDIVASAVKIDHGAKAEGERKKNKPRTVKIPPGKTELFTRIKELFEDFDLPFKVLTENQKFLLVLEKEAYTINLTHVTKKTLNKGGEITDFATEHGVKW